MMSRLPHEPELECVHVLEARRCPQPDVLEGAALPLLAEEGAHLDGVSKATVRTDRK